MEPRAFLRAIADGLRDAAPKELGALHVATRWQLAQGWYGNRQIHYECWVRRRLGTIEIGLHFEADPLTNARLLGAFRKRERAIRRGLGAAPRIEEWDRGWARVWEPLPATRLDGGLREGAVSRLALYVAVLEPILRADLPDDVEWAGP
ncbi:MAG: hypothetical protein ACRDGE_09835 [Candidatus Limnocylindria bacterium]